MASRLLARVAPVAQPPHHLRKIANKRVQFAHARNLVLVVSPAPIYQALSCNSKDHKQLERSTLRVMAQSSLRPAAHAELLRKVFDLPGRGLSQPLAESILSLDFPESDSTRITELNAKANEGQLTELERDELEAYANIADLLAYWQLKATQALQRG